MFFINHAFWNSSVSFYARGIVKVSGLRDLVQNKNLPSPHGHVILAKSFFKHADGFIASTVSRTAFLHPQFFEALNDLLQCLVWRFSEVKTTEYKVDRSVHNIFGPFENIYDPLMGTSGYDD
jgi:hypothetical protein